MYTVRGVPLHRVTCDQFNFLFKDLLVSFQVKSDIVPHKRMASLKMRMGVSHNEDGVSHNEDGGPTNQAIVKLAALTHK